MYSYGPQHVAVQKQDDQHEHTFSNYVMMMMMMMINYRGGPRNVVVYVLAWDIEVKD